MTQVPVRSAQELSEDIEVVRNEYENFLKRVTGVSGIEEFNSKEFGEVLVEKRMQIRLKYNLPDRMPYFKGEKPLGEYTTELLEILNKFGVLVKFVPEGEIQNMAKDTSARALCDDKNSTLYLHDKYDKNKVQDIKLLEHELVHALQKIVDPEMPYEHREAEAYLAVDIVDEDLRKPNMRHYLFSLIKFSSETDYRVDGITPPWFAKNHQVFDNTQINQ